MAKHGPKPFILATDRLMPVYLIAQQLGISPRTVHADLRNGLSKLRSRYAEVR